jgi:hypothetical protein
MTEQLFGDASISWYIDSIVQVKYLENWKGEDNLETAQQVVDGIRSFANTKDRVGILFIPSSLYRRKEVLDFYQQQDINEIARAVVVKSYAAKLVGNMYLRLANGKPNENGRLILNRLFSNEEKAIVWLQQELKRHKGNSTAQ